MVLLQQRYVYTASNCCSLLLHLAYSDRVVYVPAKESIEFTCEAAQTLQCNETDGELHMCMNTIDPGCESTWRIQHFIETRDLDHNYIRTESMEGCTRKAINITLFPTCNYTFQPDAVPIVNGTTLYCIVGPRNQCGNLSRKLHTSSTTYVLEGMLEIAIISGCC